ncbi:MAG: GPW/gp25 family protein [Acidobacteriota bacterium]|nr:GPW/gp25 family protein [Acidobacteriota bacterium]
MDNLHGSTIHFPPRASATTGGLVTTADKTTIIVQAIEDILETRKTERVMMPDYGIPDFVFDVVDAGFSARIAYHLKDQIDKYCSLVESVTAKAAVDDAGRAVVFVTYRERGSFEAPRNLTFPVWKYIGNSAE